MNKKPIIITRGLVIREQAVGESDRLATIFTADMGVIRAFARRAKVINDRKGSATSLLFYSRFELTKGRNSYIISDAFAIDGFRELQKDLEKLSLALYFCDLVGEIVTEGERAHDQLRLLLNVLKFAENGTFSVNMLKSIFELRLLSLSGFMPDLNACEECGETAALHNQAFFCPERGAVLCQSCRQIKNYSALAISNSCLNAMRVIAYGGPASCFNLRMPDRDWECLEDVTERYMVFTLQRRLKTLDFYRSIQSMQ